MIQKTKRTPEVAPFCHSLQMLYNWYESACAANWLDYSEITPLTVDRLQLVYPSVVGVQEVATIRDRMVVRSPDRATGPAAATCSSPAAAMLAGFFAEFDAVLHLIFDASEARRNQPPITLKLFFGHNSYSTQKPGERFARMRRPPSRDMIFRTKALSTTTIAQKLLVAKGRFQAGQTAKPRQGPPCAVTPLVSARRHGYQLNALILAEV